MMRTALEAACTARAVTSTSAPGGTNLKGRAILKTDGCPTACLAGRKYRSARLGRTNAQTTPLSGDQCPREELLAMALEYPGAKGSLVPRSDVDQPDDAAKA